MPLASHEVVPGDMGFWEPAQIILSICSLISMITVLSMCTCCRKQVKHRDRDPEDVYGRVNTAAVTTASGEAPSVPVQFRSGGAGSHPERHSQPSGKRGFTNQAMSSSRASVPLQTGRALPQLPADLYSAIDKSRKEDIRFVDENGHPMYESIDPENDSIVDPLYSKVGDLPTGRRERKYDYPVFKKRADAPGTSNDDVLYQSASQIYTAGSEDPYSSITSGPVVASSAVDEDSSSAYDPGYAKVQPQSSTEAKRQERLERTERELNDLYSMIRRSSSRDRASDSPIPGPSRITLDDVMGDDDTDGAGVMNVAQSDTQSVASRDPSYRYITVRESAEVVRERLRQQGQLGPPVREHYYSTIGNEYETVGDGASSTYSSVRPNAISDATTTAAGPSAYSLSIATSPTREIVPPPPTSPIPDRTQVLMGGSNTRSYSQPAMPPSSYSSTTNNSGSQPNSAHSTSNTVSTARTIGGDIGILPSSPYRSQISPINSTLERINEPISGATYAVVTKKPQQQQSILRGGVAPGPSGVQGTGREQQHMGRDVERTNTIHQTQTTFGVTPRDDASMSRTTYDHGQSGHQQREQLGTGDRSHPAIHGSDGVMSVRKIDTAWNGPSLSTASSFAGLNRPAGPYSPQPVDRPLSTVAGIQEFMQRPVLPYSTSSGSAIGPDTLLGRKVTEERETVVENRHSSVRSPFGHPNGGSTMLSTSSNPNNRTISGFDRSFECSVPPYGEQQPERVHHVEIKRIGEGPSADDIISGRRYRSSNESSPTKDGLLPLNLNSQSTSKPGPSSPNEAYSLSSRDITPHSEHGDDSLMSERSRYGNRSALPVLTNGDEIRRLTERSRQRSLEREREEQERRSREAAAEPLTTRLTDRSRERRKPWKEETEEQKRQRLGTIYTANDYVSPVDMSTARPWPMLGSSSPPSLRKQEDRDIEKEKKELDNNNLHKMSNREI